MATAKKPKVKLKVQKDPLLKPGSYDVKKVNELNFFDLSGAKAKTKGTSNKMYHAELHVAKSGNEAQIYSMYGATGSVQTKDYRWVNEFDDNVAIAEQEYEKILKSKRKKGYKDIDVAQRALGTDEAKTITKAVTLKNADHLKKKRAPKSLLDAQTQSLMKFLFGATQDFVTTTLKCPLGQLTNQQIDDGRTCLERAKKIVNSTKSLSKKQLDELLDVTNDFYGLIPHNLGAGARGQMTHLILDDLTKIMQKEDDLDTLLDAKSVGAVLSAEASVDAKYKTLNAEIKGIEHGSPMFKFVSAYFDDSKCSGHGYGRSKVVNVWSVNRKDGEETDFFRNAKNIAKNSVKYNYVNEASRMYKTAKNFSIDHREDLDKYLSDLYKKSNVWFCWHGTRSANLVGITKRGLLIRPAGAVITGAMYGPGKYFAHQSSKSLNYCDGGYWTGGRKGNTSKYMFLLDVAMGNMYVARGAHYYHKPPSGFHSVYGRAGRSGVMNDEMITYDPKPEQRQSRIRYLLEIN